MNLDSRLVGAAAAFDVDVVNRPAIVDKTGAGGAKGDCVHPTSRRLIGIVRLDRCLQVECFTRQTMQQVAVMDVRVLDFYVGSRIGEQDTLVGLGRRQVNVAEIRTPLRVEVDPEFQAFYLQVLQIDFASQVQRVEVFDTHSGQHAANLPKLLTRAGIVELEAD